MIRSVGADPSGIPDCLVVGQHEGTAHLDECEAHRDEERQGSLVGKLAFVENT